jgi:hypothetical protein
MRSQNVILKVEKNENSTNYLSYLLTVDNLIYSSISILIDQCFIVLINFPFIFPLNANGL